MAKTTEDVSDECPVCGQKHCPCTLCHGDPDYFLGANGLGSKSLEEDSIFCGNCGVRLA